MVLVSPLLNPTASWEFEGEILVLHHPTTISTRYQAMVHCGSLRQTAQIQSMSQECLRTGDKALVHFRFIKHPEYIKPGLRLVFREGRTKAVGNVVRAIAHTAQTQTTNRSKPTKMQRYSQQQQPQQSSELQDNGEKLENQPQKPSKRNRGRRTYSTPVVTTTTVKEN